jgi:hypothetical protein
MACSAPAAPDSIPPPSKPRPRGRRPHHRRRPHRRRPPPHRPHQGRLPELARKVNWDVSVLPRLLAATRGVSAINAARKAVSTRPCTSM